MAPRKSPQSTTTLRFVEEKVTKGAVMLLEDSENPAVGRIYFRKDHLKALGIPEDAVAGKSRVVEIDVRFVGSE